METKKITAKDTEVFSPSNAEKIESDISHRIIGCAMKVHSGLGPGLLESAYKECLFYELKKAGMDVKKEVPMPLVYSEVKLDIGYRIDLLVENKVVVEIKAVECFTAVHLAQVLTYLKFSECKLGLLINFNVASLRYGIKRAVSKL